MTDRHGAPPAGSTTDADLLARWRGARDEGAFARLSERHAPWVRGVCRRRLADPALVEDAVQAVFILLARGGPRDAQALPAWLLRVAITTCAQALRAESRRRHHEAVAARQTVPGGDGEDDEGTRLRAGLDEAIAALRPTQRAAVVGYYLQGLPQAEVARQLGCSEDAVKMRVHAALAKLRGWFAKRGMVVGGGAIAAALAQAMRDAGGAAPAVGGQAAQALADATRLSALPLQTGALAIAGVGAVALGAVALGWSLVSPGQTEARLAAAVAEVPAPERRRLPDDPFVRPDRDAQVAAGIDRILLTDALGAAPTSILADPEAAAWRAHVEHEARRWWHAVDLDEDVFPLVALLDGAQRSTVQLLPWREGDRDLRWLHAADLGSAAPAVRAWEKREFAGVGGITVGGYAGFQGGGETALARGAQWIYGADAAVSAHAQRAHAQLPATPDVPLWARCDGRPLIAGLVRLAAIDPAIGTLADGIMPAWRKARPQAEIAIDTDRGAWRTRASIDGTPQPWLRPIAPELARLVPAERDVVVAFGLDPIALLRSFIALAGKDGADPASIDDALRQAFGMDRASLEANAALLTGDVFLTASWGGGPIPTGAVCALLRDPAGADRLLDQALRALGAKPGEVAGAQRAWRLATPLGAVSVARQGTRLVAGTDPAEVDRLLRGVAAGAGIPAATAFRMRIELAKPGALFLPVLFAAARRMEKQIGPDPFFSLAGHAARWHSESDPRRPRSVWEAIHNGGASSRRLGGLRQIFGHEGLEAAVDRSMCLLRAPQKNDHGLFDQNLVVRTAEGYLCSWRVNPAMANRLGVTDRSTVASLRQGDGWRWQAERQSRTFSAEEFATAFAGWTRIAGPEVADLPLIAVPTPVMFDQRWLPPLAVALRHLPPTDLTIAVHGDRIEASERGAPVLAASLGVGVFCFAGLSAVTQHLELRLEAERQERALWAKHPQARKALAALAAALRDDHQAKRLSELAAKGSVRLEECAPLFGGRTPAADELDDLGPLAEVRGMHFGDDLRFVRALDATTWAGIDFAGALRIGSGTPPPLAEPRGTVSPGPAASEPPPADF